ncbi:MAG TPA: glycoside hydrolase family 38 C-terminal domain-containing protein [Candidatus Hydrogenedentes bacterium]|nr:glycoside hydrolase family 38 C-terminal domain-containing protein [Candidatus Hydrogenedentota bacterium]HPG66831.1 glycoside hydrolase family 38 C-terminal domain-containing protein [Candidatus Hydrogenedentota bacterium]
MSQPYEIHVISNTHWDREWLFDFQETRLLLVEFLDSLLDILDNEPRYDSFLLDSQAVPLEDYLELRPENRARVEKHVAAGRLMVGPWYTCPEGFCVNGESLVRNLLYGHRVARAFGGVMKVGHTPFSYGQNSQMPQIYAGFGIDTILFYHGVSHDDTANEFIFEGADGTQILGSQMSAHARYNFYFGLYRPVLYGEYIDDRVTTWTRGGLPFHRCSEAHCMEHHDLLDAERHYYRAKLKPALEALLAEEKDAATTRFIAFMQGHDSSVGDTLTLRIIDDAQQYLGRDKMFHSNLPALMEKVKGAAKDLEVLKGERRVPKPMGGRIHLYSDVLSSRTRMKRLNARAETALQRWAEPYAALTWALGAAYPKSALDLAWKTLLKCHAHDSIAGSGVDEIERDMNYRLRQVINVSEGLTRRSLEFIQGRIDNSAAARDDVLFTVFNAAPRTRSEVVTVVADLPSTSGYGPDLSLIEPGHQRPIPVQVCGRRPHQTVVNHLGNAPEMMACERVRFHFAAENVPAFGYATYYLRREAVDARGTLVAGRNTMENEHLSVHINADGTLDITDKASGQVFSGLHYFEDSGEGGVAWMHVEPQFDQVLTSLSWPAVVALVESGPLLARYRIEYRIDVPVHIEEAGDDDWKRLDGFNNSARRSPETRTMKIVSEITLTKGARAVDVVTRFDNPCKDHRLRVLFPTRLAAKTCHVENAFDVVERPIEYGPNDPWARAVNPTFPMHRFVDVSDGAVGLAVVNDGIREYQITNDADRAIAVTLMRAYEIALATVSKRWERHPEMELSQCPGAHEFHYRIYPHAGTWAEGDVFAQADALTAPLEPAQVGPHGGHWPTKQGLLAIEPDGLVLTALKQSEDGEGLVLRVFNPGTKATHGTIHLPAKIQSATVVSLEEMHQETLELHGKSLRVSVGPKKILTVKAVLAT